MALIRTSSQPRRNALWERVQSDALPGETLQLIVPFVQWAWVTWGTLLVWLPLLVVLLMLNVIIVLVVAAVVVTVVSLLLPAKSLVLTDRRLLIYRASHLSEQPRELLEAVDRTTIESIRWRGAWFVNTITIRLADRTMREWVGLNSRPEAKMLVAAFAASTLEADTQRPPA